MAEEKWRTRRQGRGYRKRDSREKEGEPGVGEVAAGSRGKAGERQREGTGEGRERGERENYESEEGERGHRPREERYRRSPVVYREEESR